MRLTAKLRRMDPCDTPGRSVTAGKKSRPARHRATSSTALVARGVSDGTITKAFIYFLIDDSFTQTLWTQNDIQATRQRLARDEEKGE